MPPKAAVARTQLVWASGLRTWERLAERGVWVNGCAEGLGEHESPRIETLADVEVKWVKLTHADAPAENGIDSVATYRLIPNEKTPSLEGEKYFFWTSGSGFARALALNPWIRSMTHFCGPGNTQRALERNGIQPHIFLDHDQWLKEMSL